MDIRITPRALNGELDAVESKSDAHRQLIAASLSRTPTKLRVRAVSKDIAATIACLRQAGARIVPGADGRLHITPLWAASAVNPVFDCGESGSTLRFLLPVAAAVFNGFTLTGSGRLPQRPLAPIVEAMADNGCSFNGAALPMTVTGHLSGGVYELPGDISSQFVSGLLLALPLLDGDSEIVLTTPLESTGYVDMTLATLARFSIKVARTPRGYALSGPQTYASPGDTVIEGDWSNAAFWFAAAAVGGQVTVRGLDPDSPQGDKQMVSILAAMGAKTSVDKYGVTVAAAPLNATRVDVADIPDLVPVLAAVMAVAQGESAIVNARRVRLKESDRLSAVARNLNAIGADITENEDSLIIRGRPTLRGGTADGCNDHRIVMALAAVSAACDNDLVITGAHAVEKSYPGFFEHFNSLGGETHVL